MWGNQSEPQTVYSILRPHYGTGLITAGSLFCILAYPQLSKQFLYFNTPDIRDSQFRLYRFSKKSPQEYPLRRTNLKLYVVIEEASRKRLQTS